MYEWLYSIIEQFGTLAVIVVLIVLLAHRR